MVRNMDLDRLMGGSCALALLSRTGKNRMITREQSIGFEKKIMDIKTSAFI